MEIEPTPITVDAVATVPPAGANPPLKETVGACVHPLPVAISARSSTPAAPNTMPPGFTKFRFPTLPRVPSAFTAATTGRVPRLFCVESR